MFKKKGFTLLELIIVVIIIGVLAGLAVPQYLRAVERAKISKAKQILANAMQAEKLYHIEAVTYTQSFLELDAVFQGIDGAIGSDNDWNYGVTFASADAFNIYATRSGGASDGKQININQLGVWNSDHPQY